MTSPRRAIAIACLAACAVAALARGDESAATSPPSNGAASLAPYAVTDTFVGEFSIEGDGSTRMPLRLVSVRQNPNAPVAPRYTGAGIKSGDEIVRVAGRLVADMAPRESGRLIFQTVVSHGYSRTIEIEVRSPGAKEVRKATLRFVPAPPGTKPDYSDAETAKSHGLPPPRPATDK